MRYLGLFVFFFGLNQSVFSQEITRISYADLAKWKKDKSDTVYVINFWATWCKPCLKELPSFESLGERFATQKVKVLLVSLDQKVQIESQLKPYVRNQYLRNKIYHFYDPKVVKWQQKIDKNWTGTLPATLIHQGRSGYTKMFVGPLTYQELYQTVNDLKP
ncbi:MAG: TlpA disulfide reductase family protein [bacterium]|nr:TlpA disulfide reductase family protein [bacterium]